MESDKNIIVHRASIVILQTCPPQLIPVSGGKQVLTPGTAVEWENAFAP